jgi:rubrerythrin
MNMDLKLAFETAMKGEIEGRELYKIAADRSDDAKAKEVFAYLAKEEDSHFKALKEMYHSLLKSEEIVIPDLPRLVRFKDATNPIFSDDFKSRLEGRHFEMSALSIALKLEQDAFQYYQKVSDESGDEGLKKFFSRLSAWEKDHYDALHREIAYLEEDYFTENRFSPF